MLSTGGTFRCARPLVKVAIFSTGLDGYAEGLTESGKRAQRFHPQIFRMMLALAVAHCAGGLLGKLGSFPRWSDPTAFYPATFALRGIGMR